MTQSDKILSVIICIILISTGVYFVFRESPAEKECVNEVAFNPRTSKMEAYYSYRFVNDTVTNFDVRQFKTKKEAVDFCVNRQS